MQQQHILVVGCSDNHHRRLVEPVDSLADSLDHSPVSTNSCTVAVADQPAVVVERSCTAVVDSHGYWQRLAQTRTADWHIRLAVAAKNMVLVLFQVRRQMLQQTALARVQLADAHWCWPLASAAGWPRRQ